MPPPLHEASPAPNGPESPDWPAGNREAKASFVALEEIMKLFPTTHRDPTGQVALRNLQKLIGYIEPTATFHLRIKTQVREEKNIDIRLDYELKSIIAELIERTADVTLTQTGQNYRARLKKKTPAAAPVAKPSSRGGHTENRPIGGHF